MKLGQQLLLQLFGSCSESNHWGAQVPYWITIPRWGLLNLGTAIPGGDQAPMLAFDDICLVVSEAIRNPQIIQFINPL